MKRIASTRSSARRWGRLLTALAGTLCCGCSADGAGLPATVDGAADGALVPAVDASAIADALAQPASDAVTFDVPTLMTMAPAGVAGLPGDVGCADGTREGFLDVMAWRRIAGCSGAWTVPGLQTEDARIPQCGRAAGNSGTNAVGFGCSVADLCSEGWHVCEGPDDVDHDSATDCESAAAPGYALFFLVRAGASPYGLCTPDPTLANDLHGCGSYGAPESNGCQPLDRRLGFVECQASGGVWSCGGADSHLEEGTLVTKSRADLGGVLCCRDPG